MKFSVIIPLYNGAKYIEDTLDSVIGQTYKNYEIVLVNDGSPDNVGEVVQNYIASHPNVTFVYLEQENRGLGGARNTAIRHSNGEIIAILDQDDRWYPEKLEKVAGVFREYPGVDVVCHNFYVFNNEKRTVSYKTGPDDIDLHRKMLFGGNRLATLGTCFKGSTIKKVGYFSEDKENMHFLEDYDLWLRMAQVKTKFCFIPDILAEYKVHDGNCSLRNIERMCRSELFVIDKNYKVLKPKKSFDWYRKRQRDAQILFLAAYSLFFLNRSYLRGGKYALKAVASDPFFLSVFVNKGLKRISRIVSLLRGGWYNVDNGVR